MIKVHILRGNDESSRRKRMHIYVSLLKQMAPEHLLATFAKLCSEILGEASDGKLSMDDTTARSVLQVQIQKLSTILVFFLLFFSSLVFTY